MKKVLLVSLALMSLSTFAKDKVHLQCTTYGDALSDVQIVTNSKGDQQIRIVGMDGKASRFMIMMPTLFKPNTKSAKTYSAARYPDSASGGEVDQAVMLEVEAGQKTARLAHKGSVFFLDCK
jgi:hypothetical protein